MDQLGSATAESFRSSGNAAHRTLNKTERVSRPAPGAARTGKRVVADQIISPAARIALKQQVQQTQVSPYLRSWLNRYTAFGARPEILWQWCVQGLEATTLSCIDPALATHLTETKFLFILWDVLMDDVADHDQDMEMLSAASALLHGGLMPVERFQGRRRQIADMIAAVWREVTSRMVSYPRYGEFKDFFTYDCQQLVNAFFYTLISNRTPSSLNVVENDAYQVHGTTVTIQATMGLCCSASFDASELGTVREAFWHAQCMTRIGNMVTGWEREVHAQDFASSGIFAQALSDGVLTAQNLAEQAPESIIRVIKDSGYEDRFFDAWFDHQEQILRRAERVKSIDLVAYAAGFERLMQLDLAVRGMK